MARWGILVATLLAVGGGDALAADPMIQKVLELFEARSVQMDYDGPDATSKDLTLGAGGVWFVARPRGVNGAL